MTAPNAGFVWSIAGMPRGPFKPKECGKVILPFIVLARLDAVLASTKHAVLGVLPDVENRPEPIRERLLRDAAGVTFYYASRYNLRRLDDPAHQAAT